ncbi:NAD-dependent epimerase [Shewanella sp. FJAT-52076]|uniref:NAD-dependent epimerase n=1 Tax=Shewanella sp. FJAT-52076 TaxID=2864202 RepID=UPI001C655245|nr:NAD-dependent epimerase [Shewanella sp. FJAT-52076]QYJ77249.1 NAD-dependent epimerase [Shewanella sp. FJAT-52076]
MKVLVTGAAGFIGAAACNRLLAEGHQVYGIDNLNDYYDVSLKQARLAALESHTHFQFQKMELADRGAIVTLFDTLKPDWVLHLGAQAGVRYSIDNPHAYADANLVGHLNILEGCRQSGVKHLVYASSSSVYGLNKKLPFATSDSVDHPVSLYAATKKANELMSHSYAHLYGVPCTGLRFFTVYGPWGRPDMAPMLFARAIMAGEPIKVFNQGDMSRDFTFIDDIIEGVVGVLPLPPAVSPGWSVESGKSSESSAPYRVLNIGHGSPVSLMHFIETLENALGRKAIKQFLPMQDGDVKATWADTEDLFAITGVRPKVAIEEGVKGFADWYLGYFNP